jgi:hypothetical protein
MTSSPPCALAARSSRARAISTTTWLRLPAKGAKAWLLTMNYGWADAGVEKTSPQRLLRSHLTLVLTLIPIVLTALSSRIKVRPNMKL